MTVAIDNACTKADFWPDAVVCGHAHLYQRIVRQMKGRQIPYLIAGAGGYGINPQQELAKSFTQTLPANMQKLIEKEGYLRVTVSRPSQSSGTLRFEYFTTEAPILPSDICEVNFESHVISNPGN